MEFRYIREAGIIQLSGARLDNLVGAMPTRRSHLVFIGGSPGKERLPGVTFAASSFRDRILSTYLEVPIRLWVFRSISQNCARSIGAAHQLSHGIIVAGPTVTQSSPTVNNGAGVQFTMQCVA